MPLALPRLLSLLAMIRLPEHRHETPRREPQPIDLCLMPPYLRRDIGFEQAPCDEPTSWRRFR